jgi:hypothetical protein
MSREIEFIVQSLNRNGLRQRIRHIYERSDSSGDGGSRFAVNVAFVRQTRFAEMDLVVDQTGQQQQTFCIDNVFTVSPATTGTDLLDSLSLYPYIRFTPFPFVND